MANLLSTLTRIEPTRGLIEYVNHVKPYHSKILDIQIEYVYRDLLLGTAVDSDTKHIEKFSSVRDVLFADCGYGRIWDTPGEAETPYAIVHAEARSADVANANSFTIEPAPFTIYNFFTINTTSNVFKAGTAYDIIASSPVNKTFTVTGDITADLTPGIKIGVNLDRENGSFINRQFTVVSAVLLSGDTVVTVLEQTPSQLVFPSTLIVFIPMDVVPRWFNSPFKVNVNAPSGTLPLPLQFNDQYFVVPGSNVGEFNLAYTRYPVKFSDYVDITDAGTGPLTIQQAEPFVPGNQILVGGTELNRNDGLYTVRFVVQDGPQYIIIVHEPVTTTTPVGLLTDGSIFPNSGGFDSDVECELASAPDLYARGRSFETLNFEFGLGFRDDGLGEAIENPPTGGYSTDGFGSPEGYDINQDNFEAQSVLQSSLIMTPAGFDTLFFDVSAFDSSPTNPTNPGP